MSRQSLNQISKFSIIWLKLDQRVSIRRVFKNGFFYTRNQVLIEYVKENDYVLTQSNKGYEFYTKIIQIYDNHQKNKQIIGIETEDRSLLVSQFDDYINFIDWKFKFRKDENYLPLRDDITRNHQNDYWDPKKNLNALIWSPSPLILYYLFQFIMNDSYDDEHDQSPAGNKQNQNQKQNFVQASK